MDFWKLIWNDGVKISINSKLGIHHYIFNLYSYWLLVTTDCDWAPGNNIYFLKKLWKSHN